MEEAVERLRNIVPLLCALIALSVVAASSAQASTAPSRPADSPVTGCSQASYTETGLGGASLTVKASVCYNFVAITSESFSYSSTGTATSGPGVSSKLSKNGTHYRVDGTMQYTWVSSEGGPIQVGNLDVHLRFDDIGRESGWGDQGS